MTTFTKIRSEVYCTVLFEGIHNWPDCPIEEVKYLQYPHRHIFYIRAYKEVNHDDRDVEFIWLKHRIQEFLQTRYPDGNMEATSCEMLARELINEFSLSRCDVSEDNENGAILEWVECDHE